MSGTRSLSLLQQETGNNLVQSLSHAYLSGAFAFGVAKLLQNVIAELLTRRGSVRYDRQYGCDLVGLIGTANVSSLEEVGHLIHVAVLDVKRNIQSRTVGNEPLDEILEDIEIGRLQQELDCVRLTLRVAARSGSAISYGLAIRFDS